MPAEWHRHAATLIAWPTETRRDSLWGDLLEPARDTHASLAAAVSRFEPVVMVADPASADDAARRCGSDVEVVALPIDDSWIRDSGPIFVHDHGGEVWGTCFGFNAWGQAFPPWDRDAAVAPLICDHLGIRWHDATDFVLEGGSLAVDGVGLGVTTERCLLNQNRGHGRTKAGVGDVLRQRLGIDRLVWLPDGIAEDDGTDGHVDNVATFTGVGHVMVQGCDDSRNPNHTIAAQNRERLEEAGVEVTTIPVLPYATVAGSAVPVPYGNFYICNGAVIVPTVDGGDVAMLDLIGEQLGDREVVPHPGEVLAFGGGGVHCITQQVPTASTGSP